MDPLEILIRQDSFDWDAELRKDESNPFCRLGDDVLYQIFDCTIAIHYTLIALKHASKLFNYLLTKTTAEKTINNKITYVVDARVTKLWKRIVFNYWPSFISNDKMVQKYCEKICKRWDLFFQLRFIIIKKHIIASRKIQCSKKHELIKTMILNSSVRYKCNGCRREFGRFMTMFGCDECKYYLCQTCYQQEESKLEKKSFVFMYNA